MFKIKTRFRTCIVVLTSASLLTSGCASTRSSFVEKHNELDRIDFCQNYVKDYEELHSYQSNPDNIDHPDDRRYLRLLGYEVDRRNLSILECKNIVDEHSESVAAGILAAAAIIAIAAAASQGGGGGYSSSSYKWDQFYDQYGNLTWRCRDTSNGQFAYDYNCSGQSKIDSTWPGK